MENNILPIGSVVLLKNAKKKLFVAGYAVNNKEENNKLYDYLGYPFPEGFISPNMLFLFNSDEIEQVYYEGYKDDNYYIVNDDIKEYLKNSRESNHE